MYPAGKWPSREGLFSAVSCLMAAFPDTGRLFLGCRRFKNRQRNFSTRVEQSVSPGWVSGWAAGWAPVALEEGKASPWRKAALIYPGDPSSCSLSENTKRGCFWFFPFPAWAWLFGPSFPQHCLSLPKLDREGFVQISDLPSNQAALGLPHTTPALQSTASKRGRLLARCNPRNPARTAIGSARAKEPGTK